MRYSYAFHSAHVTGLVFVMIVGSLPAVANPYSGLADPHTAAQSDLVGEPPSGVSSPSRYMGPSSVAGTPAVPEPTTRPANWPGQPAEYPDTGHAPSSWIGALQPQQSPAGSPPGATVPAVPAPAVETKRCEDAQIVARVGTEVILVGDVMAVFVQSHLEDLEEAIPEEYREKILINALPRAIIIKLMYLEAKQTIPEENLPRVQKEIRGFFYRKSIPSMMKRAKVATVDELGQKLADLGTSLQWQQQLFIEQALGQQWMSMEVKFDAPVSPEDMYSYYHQHISDYEHASRARWEELMVSFSECPSREAAYERIAQLGNQVINGLPFAEAARRGSDGATAPNGGVRDWTTQGSLVSDELNAALFGRQGQQGLPVGALSPILQSQSGYHIIRVIEREDAHRTPFTEVQADIRKAIQDQRGEDQSRAYLARLKENTPIWTIYDEALAKKNGPRSDDETTRR